MDILADSPLIPASFFLGFYVFDPPATQGRSLFPIAIPVSVLWSMAMLCMAFFLPRIPLSEQGIWQRRGLFHGRFLCISILGSRVLSSFSFRCSWYLVATGFVLWTVFFGSLFWSNLLCVTASFVVCYCLLP